VTGGTRAVASDSAENCGRTERGPLKNLSSTGRSAKDEGGKAMLAVREPQDARRKKITAAGPFEKTNPICCNTLRCK
jgi:hypothetical protein